MRAHILQHVPFEDIGCMRELLQQRGAVVSYTRFFDDPVLPALDDVDLLIVMGGPMSVNDEAELPWLRDEKRSVADAIGRGVPTLGVCLGAQVMASALGARVYPQAEKEIGWFPIEIDADGRQLFPEGIDVFHWHGETFDLPDGAVRLAHTPACAHQAFRIGRHAIGLQFHLEMTAESVGGMVTHCGHELIPSRYVQAAEEICAAPASRFFASNLAMARVLDELASW